MRSVTFSKALNRPIGQYMLLIVSGVFAGMLLWPSSTPSAEPAPHMTVQFESIVVQVPDHSQKLRKAYLTVFAELSQMSQIAKVCGRYRELNEVAALVSLKHQMKRNRMPVTAIRKEVKQRIRNRFPDLRLEDLYVIEGERAFGTGSSMMEMPGTNEHCRSLVRTPLDVLARDIPVVPGALPFSPAVLLDGEFPLALAALGTGSLPKDDPVPTLYIASAASGALALVGLSGGLLLRRSKRRREEAKRRRAFAARRRNAEEAPRAAPAGAKVAATPVKTATQKAKSKASARTNERTDGLRPDAQQPLQGQSWGAPVPDAPYPSRRDRMRRKTDDA